MMEAKKSMALDFGKRAFDYTSPIDSINYIRVINNYIVVLVTFRKWKDVEEYKTLLKQYSPDFDKAKIMMANIDFWMGNWDASVGQFNEILSQSPNQNEASVAYAGIQYHLNQRDSALNILSKSIQENPANPDAKYLLNKWNNQDRGIAVISGNYFEDNGGNSHQSTSIRYQLARQKKWLPYVSFEKFSKSNFEDNRLKYTRGQIGTRYLLNKTTELDIESGISMADRAQAISPFVRMSANKKIHLRHRYSA